MLCQGIFDWQSEAVGKLCRQVADAILGDPDAIQFWMGDGRHCLHYPIGANGDHNFFLVERNPSPSNSAAISFLRGFMSPFCW